MSSAWTRKELDLIGAAQELEIAARRRDGSLRQPLPIWVVRVGDELYVRSWRGTDGGWYRTARTTHEARVSAGGIERDVSLPDAGDDVGDDVDAAYRAKYGRNSSYVEAMIAPPARATTLKLAPRREPDRGG